MRQRLAQASWDLCVVVNDARVVLGLLTQEELEADTEQRVKGARS
jgi:hypothetical protein